jgi:hypothetical protein
MGSCTKGDLRLVAHHEIGFFERLEELVHEGHRAAVSPAVLQPSKILHEALASHHSLEPSIQLLGRQAKSEAVVLKMLLGLIDSLIPDSRALDDAQCCAPLELMLRSAR